MRIVIEWPDDSPLPTRVSIVKPKSHPKRLRQADITEAVKLYIAGVKIDTIAKRFGRTPRHIKHVCRQNCPPEFLRDKRFKPVDMNPPRKRKLS